MALSKGTTNLAMGRCNITFGGTTIGHTQGGCEVEVVTEAGDMLVDDYGSSPVDKVLTGIIATIKVPLSQNQIEVLDIAYPAGTTTGTTKHTMGGTVGKLLSTEAAELVLHPAKNGAGDLSQDVVLHSAVVMETAPLPYRTDEQWKAEVTFIGLVDTTNSDGNMIILFGDSTT